MPIDGKHEVAVDRAPAGGCVSHEVGVPCCTSGEGGEGAVAGESSLDDSSSWASANYDPKGLCLESCDEAEGSEATEVPHDELFDAKMDRSATVPDTPRVGLVPASKTDAGMPSPEARALSPGETRPSDPGQAQQGDLRAPESYAFDEEKLEEFQTYWDKIGPMDDEEIQADILKANADLAERLRKGVRTADADQKAPMGSDVESPPVTDELRLRESFILKTLLGNSLETKPRPPREV